jgi:hypothetical protein
MNARTAFAETLAQHLDLDLDPEVMDAIDRVLASLYLRGFTIVPLSDGEPGPPRRA